MDDSNKVEQQIAERIKQGNNVLVAVNSDPNVDQLAAAIGLTLMLNKMDKHGTAVFSGQVPSVIEFLQPEKTFEKDTNSLRDFIIALDKSKADKLRYKVEDTVVKIFITPYRTSLSDKDLEFSEGDFNVDVVVCLGVNNQDDLDQAIAAHGRILHDATVVSINNTSQDNKLGSINWYNEKASSLCEMVATMAEDLGKNLLDESVATALLTGIVAETERFSNEKTSSKTMSASAKLMAAGADQQLVATELQAPAEPESEPEIEPEAQASPDENADENSDNPAAERNHNNDSDESDDDEPPKPNDGTLEIDHQNDKNESDDKDGDDNSPATKLDESSDGAASDAADGQVHIDSEGKLQNLGDDAPAFGNLDGAKNASGADDQAALPGKRSDDNTALGSAKMGGGFTANSQPEGLDPAIDPMSLPGALPPLMHRGEIGENDATSPPAASDSGASAAPATDNISGSPADNDQGGAPKTLQDLEQAARQAHAGGAMAEQSGAPDQNQEANDGQASSLNLPDPDPSPPNNSSSLDSAQASLQAAASGFVPAVDTVLPADSSNNPPAGDNAPATDINGAQNLPSPMPSPIATNATAEPPPAVETMNMPTPLGNGNVQGPAYIPSAPGDMPPAQSGRAPITDNQNQPSPAPPVPPPMLPPPVN
ncbi:MAG: hypothetical protein ACREGA_01355 [Candidatus Saccharimonadales bacterium]